MRRKKLRTAGTGSDTDGAFQVEVTMPGRRERCSRVGSAVESKPVDGQQIPRIVRLMALAIKFQDMVDRGDVGDYADLARLGHVSRARLTQIMNLCHLAPDVQESLLSYEDDQSSPLTTTERDLRKVLHSVCWVDQRQAFIEITKVGAKSDDQALRLTKAPR